ncbi:hypothetical protein GXM_04963 [Nostoc sphaeroides CCNUC1]|uniref:Uncharacterized protein n=1 Tax=Nostoc sphaeroides CCNUC1 TaxID=2653204 RepID=A0A5P8W4N7_9NOSO|nr:hypothetical protein GXM_04963 [Nostoc sphaeroides CCNUC1]
MESPCSSSISKSRANIKACLIFSSVSSGNLPSLRSSLTAGIEPKP